jgi:hypothetical protein
MNKTNDDKPKLDNAALREVRRAKLKRAASLRAQLMFDQNLARIDHRLDVIEPAVQEIEARAEQGEIPQEAS